MKIRILLIFILAFTGSMVYTPVFAESTRKERRAITKGNDLYKERKFVDAQKAYEEALRENASSAEARYNLGLSQVRQIANLADTTAANAAKINQARQNFQAVAALAKTKPGLAAKANLNLGNIEFKAQDYSKAVEYYKQSLRIDPNDEKARKNLRIAQLNLKKQNQDQNNNNQNQDKKDQDKDKDKNKEKEKNKDNNNDQNDQNKDQNKNENKDNNISQQTASQILQAVDNKENATRARVTKGNGKNKSASGRNTRRW